MRFIPTDGARHRSSQQVRQHSRSGRQGPDEPKINGVLNLFWKRVRSAPIRSLKPLPCACLIARPAAGLLNTAVPIINTRTAQITMNFPRDNVKSSLSLFSTFRRRKRGLRWNALAVDHRSNTKSRGNLALDATAIHGVPRPEGLNLPADPRRHDTLQRSTTAGPPASQWK